MVVMLHFVIIDKKCYPVLEVWFRICKFDVLRLKTHELRVSEN